MQTFSGLASNFTGNIANSDAGVDGKLTILNSGSGGSVTLSGTNTHSGGTEVQSGANLTIASGSALGSGTLALVGSSTVPATLTTTATTTIANAITVTGDPVFNVTPTTTTTITAPITDGVSAGDVVVAGGGTLALTAVNTYTGLTNISSGSTLALSGSGAIAASSGVTNNGTLNTTGKTGNVSVANYTQGSTANLAMNVSPSNTQKLLVTGTASLAGGLSLAGSAGTYSAGKYALLTANSVSGTFGSFSSNLSSLTRLSYSLAYDPNDVYLVFTPNSADIQQSLVNTSQALQSTYTLQNSVLANSFSYDCNEFGANGICVSAGGRNTAVSAANGLNNTSALLIAAYRPHPNYRIGAYADQNLSVNNASSTVNLGNNTPLIGLFGAWNERLDGTGTEIKVSAAYGQKNATVTRQVVGTSQAGSGSSQLNSQGAQVTAKYGFGITDNVIISPYVGMRYTQNNMGGYTEGTSSTVTAPLTYSALNTNATTALAGLGASYKVTPVVTTFASAGVETDTNTANGTYSASGISGLTPINFNANPVKTRPTATLGAYYDVAKNQRLGLTGIYRQEPYQGVSTTTVMGTYTIGM
ncbi:autotransporter domain-containing protein [Polynucleobacter paneuropaeus]|nr:autotransporter domain-containing protein [Polynucleobacter paneuropaeus]